jgi:O-antigen ligase
MNVALARHPAILALPAAAGALAALLLGSLPPHVAVVALAAPLLVSALVAWPWASLPLTILGGTLASQLLGLEEVGAIVTAHVALAAVGVLGVLLRRGLDPSWGRRIATSADRPMFALAALVVVGAAYGLAAGNPDDRVVVAAYQLGVVPAYFFLATLTLSSPRRLQAACVLFAVVAVGMAIAGLAQEGRHGGLFSALALAPALVAAARATSVGVRWLLLAGSALFALDVTLSAYRTIWIAAGVALLLLLVVGKGARLRGTIAVTLLLGAAVAVAGVLADAGAFRARAGLIGAAIEESAGYRAAEAQVGWEIFLENPIVGQGLGRVEPDVYLPSLGRTDVGPVYHLFYLTVATNAGLVALALLVWPIVVALRRVAAARRSLPIAFGSLLAGFAIAACFAGPTDGHWELGLLTAATLVAVRFERSGAPA